VSNTKRYLNVSLGPIEDIPGRFIRLNPNILPKRPNTRTTGGKMKYKNT